MDSLDYNKSYHSIIVVTIKFIKITSTYSIAIGTNIDNRTV